MKPQLASCDVRSQVVKYVRNPFDSDLRCAYVPCIFRHAKCDHNFASLLRTYNKIGPDSLVFFHDFFSELFVGPKSQKLDIHVSNLSRNLSKGLEKGRHVDSFPRIFLYV